MFSTSSITDCSGISIVSSCFSSISGSMLTIGESVLSSTILVSASKVATSITAVSSSGFFIDSSLKILF
jgi:hypothetical protein